MPKVDGSGTNRFCGTFDLGTVISSDSTTDAVGEARLVLQAPSTPGTANVSVTVGGTTAVNYAEFASPTAPYVRILAPTLNQTVSGFATIDLQATDPGGANQGVAQLGVIVDGQPLASVGSGPSIAWSTYSLSNGAHTIRAAASDGDLEYGYSQAVTVTASNPIHNLSISKTLFNTQDPNPSNRSTTISAVQDQALPWTVTFTKRGATSPSRTYSGTGSAISVTWDGKDNSGNATPSGQYNYNITSSGGSSSGWLAELTAGIGPTNALLVEGASLPNDSECLSIVEDACEARGFRVITLQENDATWENFQYYMMVYQPEVLYVKTHGSYEIRTGTDASPALLPQVSEFMLKDSWVYAYRPQDNQGHWYPQYPAAGQPAYANIPVNQGNLCWPQMTAHYVSELGFKSVLVAIETGMDGLVHGWSHRFRPRKLDQHEQPLCYR